MVDFDPVRDGLEHSPFVEVVDKSNFNDKLFGKTVCWTVDAEENPEAHTSPSYRVKVAKGGWVYWYCSKCVESYLIRTGLLW